MRPTDFVDSVREIKKVLNLDFLRTLLLERDREIRKAPEAGFFELIMELVRLQPGLRRIPHVREVLSAYSLEDILSDKYPSLLMHEGGRDKPGGGHESYYNWALLFKSTDVIELLLIPADLRGGKTPEEDLCFELGSDSSTVTASQLSIAVRAAQELYSTIASAMGVSRDQDELRVTYIATGSPIRMDFRGLGDVVKQAKQFLLEMFIELRDRNANHLTANADAVINAMTAVRSVDQRVKDGSLSTQDGADLKRALARAAGKVFKSGLRSCEIPDQQVIDNRESLLRISGTLPALPVAQSEKRSVIALSSMDLDAKAKGSKSARRKTKKKSGSHDDAGPENS